MTFQPENYYESGNETILMTETLTYQNISLLKARFTGLTELAPTTPECQIYLSRNIIGG
jgi:hypothetical protein